MVVIPLMSLENRPKSGFLKKGQTHLKWVSFPARHTVTRGLSAFGPVAQVAAVVALLACPGRQAVTS